MIGKLPGNSGSSRDHIFNVLSFEVEDTILPQGEKQQKVTYLYQTTVTLLKTNHKHTWSEHQSSSKFFHQSISQKDVLTMIY